MKLRVLRPSGTSFTAVASSTTVTVTSDLNTFTTNLPIEVGDVVALDNASSGLYFTNSPAIALPLVKYFQVGANSFRFTGRLANRKLAKGKYRLVATPGVGGKTGISARARFKIR